MERLKARKQKRAKTLKDKSSSNAVVSITKPLRKLTHHDLLEVLKQEKTKIALAQGLFDYLAITFFRKKNVKQRTAAYLKDRFNNTRRVKELNQAQLRDLPLEKCLIDPLTECIQANEFRCQDDLIKKIATALVGHVDETNLLEHFTSLQAFLIYENFAWLRRLYLPELTTFLASRAFDFKNKKENERKALLENFQLLQFRQQSNLFFSPDCISYSGIVTDGFPAGFNDPVFENFLSEKESCQASSQSMLHKMRRGFGMLITHLSGFTVFFLLQHAERFACSVIDENTGSDAGNIKLFVIIISAIMSSFHKSIASFVLILGLTLVNGGISWCFGLSLGVGLNFNTAFILFTSSAVLTGLTTLCERFRY